MAKVPGSVGDEIRGIPITTKEALLGLAPPKKAAAPSPAKGVLQGILGLFPLHVAPPLKAGPKLGAGPVPVPPKKAGAKLMPHGGKAPPQPPGDGSSEEDEEEVIDLDPPRREHGT